ncbi:MAG: ROK family protein [Lachnospiraceae bacterium]|nr:ROK family protein [Lachnospiraceae bacterium]
MLGALEAGGTKMVCAIGNERGQVQERISIPTVSPEKTMPEMIAFFRERQIEALGIGCFGPINPVKGTKTYGYITSTPKLAWQNYYIVGVFEKALGCPVGFDTDVNAYMLGEITFGAARGLDSCIYVTIGTGVGVGVYVNGGLLHGMMHPEAGHMLLQRHPADAYGGKCPFHGNCLEGLAAGPAIEERWGAKGIDLAQRREVWELEAFYIAQACVNYTLVYAPRKIILGGGVMHQEQLFPMIRQQYRKLMAGYVNTPELENLESYIVPCSLKDNQGIMGCLQLAVEAQNF